jgi:tRNA modification GTPase
LLELLADLEAGLDFVEEDIEFVDRDQLLARLAAARSGLEVLLHQAAGRMQVGERWRVVLAGMPNAGKSTLFNALVGREAALVSPVAGTTRDYVAAQLDFDGIAVELIDTAGREQTAEAIMLRAQDLLAEQLERADLTVWCTAANQADAERQHDAALLAKLESRGRPVLRVSTKCDLASTPPAATIRTSAASGGGLAELKQAVGDSLVESRSGRQLVGATASRCRDSLLCAAGALTHALETAQRPRGEEFIAVDLREALEHLGRILGAVYTDDILDRIFSKFCIGK